MALADLELTFRQRFERWLRRRIPPARQVTLDQQRIFIFPSRYGFFYILVMLMLFLAGINYENNLILTLTFLLASVFVVTILHTFQNFSGLTIYAGRTEPVFSGEEAPFYIELGSLGKRDYLSIRLAWEEALPQKVNVSPGNNTAVKMLLPTHKRGLLRPDRLQLETRFPLGIIRSWTLIALDMQVLVYPKPIATEILPNAGGDSGQSERKTRTDGQDEYDGLRDYQPGDPLKQVHWKAYAKSDQLQTKTFHGYEDGRQWLDWDFWPGMGVEERLSRLCYWTLRLHAEGQEYGLRLPGIVIEPDQGAPHRNKVLKELALFNLEKAIGGAGND